MLDFRAVSKNIVCRVLVTAALMATMNIIIIVVGLYTRKGIETESMFEMMEIPVEDLVAVVEDLVAVVGICLAVFHH